MENKLVDKNENIANSDDDLAFETGMGPISLRQFRQALRATMNEFRPSWYEDDDCEAVL